MKLKFLTSLLFSGFLCNSAYASMISFEAPVFSQANKTLSIDVNASFDDVTAGGDFIFNFANFAGSGLTFDSYSTGGSGYDNFGNEDGDYNIGLVDSSDDDLGMGIAAGNYFVGSLTFKVSKAGDYDFSASNINFYNLGFTTTQNVDASGTSIFISEAMISPVPEPSELLLMLSGLGIISTAIKARKSKNLV